MSAELATTQISRFLKSQSPEVLCLGGDWGVGKTYTWQKVMDQHIESDQIGLKRYAYVSLFGQTSLESVKQSLFENTEFLARNDDEFRNQAIAFGSSALQTVKKGRNLLSAIPYVGGSLEKVLTASSGVLFSTVRSQLVCIDDIERRGDSLQIKDVLGLISFLKEQRGCKIILILNDQKLPESDNDFQRFNEKVIDRFVRFAPTPKECAEIALGQIELDRCVGSLCTQLQIANIRIIKRIMDFVEEAVASIPEAYVESRKQAIHTVVLLGWCKLDPQSSPNISFIRGRKRNLFSPSGEADRLTEQEAVWSRTLRDYKFTYLDDFDEILLAGVDNGYFDQTQITKKINEIAKLKANGEGDRLITSAWDLFRSTFRDNSDEIVSLMMSATRVEGVVSLSNLDASIGFVRSLGREQDAEDMIREVVSRDRPFAFWDVQHYPYPVRLTDVNFLKAIEIKARETKVTPPIIDVIKRIGSRSGWDEEDLRQLSETQSIEIVEILKNSDGESLSEVLAGLLAFMQVSNATPEMLKINTLVREALNQIGREAAINRLRADGYLRGAR